MPILTKSTTVRNVTTGGAYGTITKVGTDAKANYNGSLRSTVNFTSVNEGDMAVVILGGVDAAPSAMSSVYASGWGELCAPRFNAGWGGYIAMWAGFIETPASDMLTVSWYSGASGTWMALFQFSAALGYNTIWSWDADYRRANASSLTMTYPTIVPSGINSLYVGGGIAGENSTAGATAGYTYSSIADSDMACYNTSVAASTTPTNPLSLASTSETVATMFRAQAPSTSVNTASLILDQVPTGKMWVISQIGFEILPTSVLTDVVARVTWNGRNLFGNINANGGSVQGPPFISMRGGDNLTIEWTGAPVGASVIANFFYTEYDASVSSSQIGQII